VSSDGHSRYHVRVLGEIAVEGPDGRMDPGGHKPRLLLALLIADAGSVVTTERLIDGLWDEDPPPTARKTLQVHVSNLRHSLGSTFPLETVRAGYRLDAAAVTIDARQFEDEVRRATVMVDSAPADASRLLATALARWRGPPYADVAGAPAIDPEVARLNELRLGAVELRIDADVRLGHHEQVLGELEALTADHPYRERLRALQMLALYRAGRQADALRVYERTRRLLADELGIGPGPELRQLQREVLAQSAQLDLDASHVSTAPRALRGYELRERLGGHDGVDVIRAYQPAVGREVAIRIIPPAMSNDPQFVRWFETECRTLAELRHPHIVGLHDYWRDPDGAYVVMPLIAGGTLERSLEDGPWGAAASLQLIEQIGSALGYAHRRGLAHGDVRPSNVLLDDDHNAYLSHLVLQGTPRSGADRSTAVGQPIGAAADVDGLAALTCSVLTGAGPDEIGFTTIDLPSGFQDVIRRATDPEPLRRFHSVDDYVRSLRRAFGADVGTARGTPVSTVERNPYKGLRAFGEIDAIDFFGRDDVLAELVDQVSRNNLTAVVGPSGCGKSSLVRAGLLPRVRRCGLGDGRDVVVAEMFPGAYPFEELAAALLRVAVDRPEGLPGGLSNDAQGLLRVAEQILPGDDTVLLLVVDQFEELFVLTADEDARSDFIASLVAVATDERSRVRIVLTLRADFYDQPLRYPAFGELVKRSLVSVTLPGEGSLAEAIAEPARGVGLEVEPGLIPTILRDVAGEPGALPLLEYALTELFDNRDDDVLTIAAYERTGGVVGALARRAETIYAELTPAGRDAAREVFLRLVAVGDESDDTRRRVRRTELEGLDVDPRALERVIGAFGEFRLLSFDRDPVTRGPTVEVAHEALIRAWPRYRGWIDERRDDLRTERRLEAAVAEWRGAGEDPSLLISGGRLAHYEHWVDATEVRLTAEEQTFLVESSRRERERAAAAARRRRLVLSAISALALVAVLAAVGAVVQRNRADDQARAAIEAASAADRLRVDGEQTALVDRARALAARAEAELDPERGLLLALAAHDSLEANGLNDPIVSGSLYQLSYDQMVDDRLAIPGPDVGDWGLDARLSPDGSMLALTALLDGRVWVVDARSMTTSAVLDVTGGRNVDRGSAMTNWDDDDLLIGDVRGTIESRTPTGELIDAVQVAPGRAVRPLFARDGLLGYGVHGVSYVGPFEVVVVDTDTGDVLFRTAQHARDASLSPDGRRLLIVEPAVVRLIDVETWSDVTPGDLSAGERRIDDAAWASGGGALWLLADGLLTRFDVDTGTETMRIESDLRGADFVAESLDGLLVATGGATSPVRVYDTSTGALAVELAKVERPTDWFDRTILPDHAVSWLPDRRLVTVGGDETVVWDLGSPNTAAAVWPAGGTLPVVTSAIPSGDVLFGSTDGAVARFDSEGRLLQTFPGNGASDDVPAVVSGDGSILARTSQGAVELFDVATGSVRAVGPDGFGRPIALSGDGALVAVATPRGSDDDRNIVEIVNGATGELVGRIGSLHVAERGAFTSDGGTVLVPITPVDQPGVSGLWAVDVSTGRTIGRGPPERCITVAAVSSDDARAATVGCDGTVSLYDVATLSGAEPWTARVAEESGDGTPLVGVTFGPDDDVVIVTREDGRVEAYSADADLERLWSFDVGDFVGMPSVRDGMVWVGVRTPFVSADVASGGAIAMPLDLDELVAFARSSVTRQLTDEECQEYLDRPTCDVA
jgi:DNA-binding SARP family transcriptional activator/WD40 repeat protein